MPRPLALLPFFLCSYEPHAAADAPAGMMGHQDAWSVGNGVRSVARDTISPHSVGFGPSAAFGWELSRLVGPVSTPGVTRTHQQSWFLRSARCPRGAPETGGGRLSPVLAQNVVFKVSGRENKQKVRN